MVYLIPSASNSLRAGLSCWAASGLAQVATPWHPHLQQDTRPEGGTQQQRRPSLLPRETWGPWAPPQNAEGRQQAAAHRLVSPGAHNLTPSEGPTRCLASPGSCTEQRETNKHL